MLHQAAIINNSWSLGRWELEFAKASVTARSSLGTPYTRSLEVGMPKLPQTILNGVVYLYPSKEAAEKGTDFGGTGFLVGIPLPGTDQQCIYFITNWHVAVRDGNSVVRMNVPSAPSGREIFEYDLSDWDFEPSGDDIAVLRAPKAPGPGTVVGLNMFATQNEITRRQVGAGDDVFMVGRFVDHDGGPVNLPSLRFGNISVMPTLIKQPTNAIRPSYCIDMHSRSGYSGSPVFVYRTLTSDLTRISPSDTRGSIVIDGTNALFMFLGIHWGQFSELMELEHDVSTPKAEIAEATSPSNKARIKGLSGMTCVIPADAILKILNAPRFADERRELEEQWKRDHPMRLDPESKS
jgi:hypothetical protein